VTKVLRIAAVVVAVAVVTVVIRVATLSDEGVERSGTVVFAIDGRICLARALDEVPESGICYILDEVIEVSSQPGDIGVRSGDHVTVRVLEGSVVEGSGDWDTVVDVEVLEHGVPPD
jgi:hypothetical protein